MNMIPNRSTTTDALIVKDSMILLIRRKNNPSKGMWALAGGYIDHGENTEHAC